MMSQTITDTAPPLQSLVHRSGWLPREGELRVLDGAWISGLPEPLWVGLAQASGAERRTCFVAVGQRDGGCHDATPWPLYQRHFLQRLARERRVPLAHGALVFDAQLPLPWAELELRTADLGASTNCVSQILVDGRGAVHKVFRHLGAADHELSACRQLQDEAEPSLPRFLGAYHYVDAQGAAHPVGLLNEFFVGRGLHVDLSLNLRALWQALDDGAGLSLDTHVAALLPELVQWRHFLDRFHDRLDRAAGLGVTHAAPAFDCAHHAARVRERLGRLLPQLHTDPLLGPAAARRLGDLLATVGHALFDDAAVQDGSLRAGACHGDLHLSHLLWRRLPEGAERRLIDLSPPALRAGDEAMRCSHRLMDWAALARALDYFYLDELTLEMKRRTGASSATSMQQQLMALLEPQGVPALDDPCVQQAAALGAAWRQRVEQALCGDAARSRAWQQFYFARLLHELDYNYVHRRPHFRCIDFHSLLRTFDPTVTVR